MDPEKDVDESAVQDTEAADNDETEQDGDDEDDSDTDTEESSDSKVSKVNIGIIRGVFYPEHFKTIQNRETLLI